MSNKKNKVTHVHILNQQNSSLRSRILVPVASGVILFFITSILLASLTRTGLISPSVEWSNTDFYNGVVENITFGQSLSNSFIVMFYWISFPFRFLWDLVLEGFEIILRFFTR